MSLIIFKQFVSVSNMFHFCYIKIHKLHLLKLVPHERLSKTSNSIEKCKNRPIHLVQSEFAISKFVFGATLMPSPCILFYTVSLTLYQFNENDMEKVLTKFKNSFGFNPKVKRFFKHHHRLRNSVCKFISLIRISYRKAKFNEIMYVSI